MTRIETSALALHLEAALSSFPDAVEMAVGGDRHTRAAGISRLAGHVAERLSCFDWSFERRVRRQDQPSLFPDDMGPLR